MTLLSSNTLYIPTLPIEQFELVLEPVEGQWYKPGDSITGKVLLKNFEQFTCGGIRVALEGSAVVNFESDKAIEPTKENLYSYDWTEVYLLGQSDQDKRKAYMVKKSTHLHEFPFTIAIKKLNPFLGTFKGSCGEIIFKVVAYIDRWSVPTPTTVEETIQIRSYMNLTAIPEILRPYIFNGEPTKELQFSLHLPRTGYLAWEQIPFNIKLTSYRFRICFPRISISLVRKLSFKMGISTRCRRTIFCLCEKSNWEFIDGEYAEWEDVLFIPDEARHPTFFASTIKCFYYIKLEVRTVDRELPFIEKIPIIFGTARETNPVTNLEGAANRKRVTNINKPTEPSMRKELGHLENEPKQEDTHLRRIKGRESDTLINGHRGSNKQMFGKPRRESGSYSLSNETKTSNSPKYCLPSLELEIISNEQSNNNKPLYRGGSRDAGSWSNELNKSKGSIHRQRSRESLLNELKDSDDNTSFYHRRPSQQSGSSNEFPKYDNTPMYHLRSRESENSSNELKYSNPLMYRESGGESDTLINESKPTQNPQLQIMYSRRHRESDILVYEPKNNNKLILPGRNRESDILRNEPRNSNQSLYRRPSRNLESSSEEPQNSSKTSISMYHRSYRDLESSNNEPKSSSTPISRRSSRESDILINESRNNNTAMYRRSSGDPENGIDLTENNSKPMYRRQSRNLESSCDEPISSSNLSAFRRRSGESDTFISETKNKNNPMYSRRNGEMDALISGPLSSNLPMHRRRSRDSGSSSYAP